MEFKDRLREILEQFNVNTKYLALKLNISERTIKKWLKGISKPKIYTLRKLCLILSVRCNYLLGIDNKIR